MDLQMDFLPTLPCGSVGLQMDFFIIFSFTPPTFRCKDNMYVFLLGTENTVGGVGGPSLRCNFVFLLKCCLHTSN